MAAELDGRAAHLRAGRWESERLRDRRLLVADWKPARITSHQLRDDPHGLETDLRALGIGDRSAATGLEPAPSRTSGARTIDG
jgi:hypothetical protein